MKPVNQEPLLPSVQAEAAEANFTRHFSLETKNDTAKVWNVAENFLFCHRTSDLPLEGRVKAG